MSLNHNSVTKGGKYEACEVFPTWSIKERATGVTGGQCCFYFQGEGMGRS